MARILVAEDNLFLLRAIQDTLELKGYSVCGVTNGAQAVEAFSHFRPELIVTDVVMSEMDGFELYHWVQRESPGTAIPFIFTSARNEAQAVEQIARNNGALCFLRKPFGFGELLETVRKLLRRREPIPKRGAAIFITTLLGGATLAFLLLGLAGPANAQGPAVVVEASPTTIVANGLTTTTITVTVTENGNPVPDGSVVTITTSVGYLDNWQQTYSGTTSSGVVNTILTSAPGSTTLTAELTATVDGGESGNGGVTFQAVSCRDNLWDWREFDSNPIFDPPGNTIVWSNAIALYDQDQFSGHGVAAPYKIWFSNGGGSIRLITSTNGVDWTSYDDALVVSGLTSPDHPVVKYYAAGFTGVNTGTNPSSMTMYYRIWYWPQGPIYTIAAIHYAESPDGVAWYNDQALTQDATQPLVTGVASSGWKRGTYGPVDVLYNPSATNSGPNPFDYSFAMYYGGTDGGREVTGLAYSANGIHWTRYGDGPVVDHGPDGAWDSNDAIYGSVIKDSNGAYHYWYGGSQDLAYHGGIGYAVSSDGIHWAKSLDNPILHYSDGESWRAEWTHTPFVLFSSTRFDGHGSPEQYKMWFSGRDVSQTISGEDAIGYAVLNLVSLSLADTSGSGQSGQVSSAVSQPFVVGLRDNCGTPASDTIVNFTISGTPAGASGQSLSVISGKTNAAGQIPSTLTLGDEPGVYTVTADAVGVLGMPMVFTATASVAPAPPPGGIYLPIILKSHVSVTDLVKEQVQ